MGLFASPKSDSSFRHKLKTYVKLAGYLEEKLSNNPDEWGRYQSIFNQEVNAVFRDLMLYEKEGILAGDEQRVYRLKLFFTQKLRNLFLRGRYVRSSIDKPYGYAGDFEIIDAIYVNRPTTNGFDRLFDNYFQSSSISLAVRNRKRDFQDIIQSVVKKASGESVKILDLASGPCRDIAELLAGEYREANSLNFVCYDSDEYSIKYGREVLMFDRRVTHINFNAVRLALMKSIEDKISDRYDLIFSTGLFDYLDDKITVRLLANLKKLLKPGGVLAISDVRDKFSNPSIYFMEWVGDWNLIYRGDDEFRNFFLEAGFEKNKLSFSFEQQGIFQYVVAQN